MFNSLSSVPKENDQIKNSVLISQESFDFLINSLPDVSPNHSIVETKKELAALISSIEEHGLSKSLISFIDYNGILSQTVPNFVGLESLNAENLETETTNIISSLQTLHDKLEVSNEGLLGAAIIDVIRGVIVGFAIYGAYTLWKKMSAGKDRVASVIHYNTVIEYLHTVLEVPGILNYLESVTLPKTQEELDSFIGKLANQLSPLKKIGIFVNKNGGDTVTTNLELPKSVNIESVGYTETSLKTIASLAQEAKSVESKLESFSTEHLDAQQKDAKKEELKFIHMGNSVVGLALHSVTTRTIKVLQLVKANCGAIEHFYSKE